MPLTTIEDIYSEFHRTYVDKPDYTIDFYKNNSNILDNIIQFKDTKELGKYIELISRYISTYNPNHDSALILDLINKYQITFDNEIQRLNASELKDIWYYKLSLIKGMISYRRKDYKTATFIFKELTLSNPENEDYRYWLNSSKAWQRHWIVKSTWIISITLAGIAIFFGIFFRDIVPYKERTLLYALAIAGCISVSIYNTYIRSILGKKKNN
jgi:hypothetical protein